MVDKASRYITLSTVAKQEVETLKSMIREMDIEIWCPKKDTHTHIYIYILQQGLLGSGNEEDGEFDGNQTIFFKPLKSRQARTKKLFYK